MLLNRSLKVLMQINFHEKTNTQILNGQSLFTTKHFFFYHLLGLREENTGGGLSAWRVQFSNVGLGWVAG